MLGILKRIAAIGRAIFVPAAASQSKANTPAAISGTKSTPAAVPTHPAVSAPPNASTAAFLITISMPQPLPHAAPDLPGHVPVTPIGTVVAEKAATIALKQPRALVSQRRAVSPIVATKALGRSVAATPRRAKPVSHSPVRTNRISSDQVRMQAALMRSRRNRDAQLALSKMKALLPTATILPLQRAA